MVHPRVAMEPLSGCVDAVEDVAIRRIVCSCSVHCDCFSVVRHSNGVAMCGSLLRGIRAGVDTAFGRYRTTTKLPDPSTVSEGTRMYCNGSTYEAFRWTDDDGPPTHWSRIS